MAYRLSLLFPIAPSNLPDANQNCATILGVCESNQIFRIQAFDLSS